MLRPLFQPVTFLRSMMPKPGVYPTLILDQFTGADTTALASHAISPTNTPATSWTVRDTAAGDFTIQTNRAQAGPGIHSHSCNPGISDGTLSATARRTASADIAIMVRLQDASNYWLVDLRGAGEFKIYEKNAGSYTERATTAATFAVNTDYALEAVLSGASISGTVDGANGINYSSAFLQTQTNHGIWASVGAGSTGMMDNFTVTQP